MRLSKRQAKTTSKECQSQPELQQKPFTTFHNPIPLFRSFFGWGSTLRSPQVFIPSTFLTAGLETRPHRCSLDAICPGRDGRTRNDMPLWIYEASCFHDPSSHKWCKSRKRPIALEREREREREREMTTCGCLKSNLFRKSEQERELIWTVFDSCFTFPAFKGQSRIIWDRSSSSNCPSTWCRPTKRPPVWRRFSSCSSQAAQWSKAGFRSDE